MGGPRGSGWIDVTVPIADGMVHWPGDPPVRIVRTRDLARGDDATVSELSLGAHTGTHVDAPAHFIAGGATVDALALEALAGEARIVALEGAGALGEAALAAADPRPGERLLLKTRNSERCWREPAFVPDFVHLSAGAARLLAARAVRTVGVDYLSVGGGGEEGREVHRILLGAGICVLEGLDLSLAPPGRCELLCLPLRIRGGDGAPARALVRPLG